MKAKFGSFIVDGRGKVNGHVISKNRAGSYIRTKVTPVNPRSTAQLTQRARLQGQSVAWRGLTATQRQSWIAGVKNFQRTNIFGDLKTPSGFNLYQRLNNNLLKAGQAAIVSAPAPANVATVNIGVLTATVAGGVISLALSGAVPAATTVVFRATPPLSAGISFVKSQLRVITTFAAASASPLVATAAYAAKYGAFVAGQKIFVSIEFVNNVTGQNSVQQITSAISA
jgi:hypothetical protein